MLNLRQNAHNFSIFFQSKSKAIIFARHVILDSIAELRTRNKQIIIEDNLKVLGVYLDKKLNFRKRSKEVEKEIRKLTSTKLVH